MNITAIAKSAKTKLTAGAVGLVAITAIATSAATGSASTPAAAVCTSSPCLVTFATPAPASTSSPTPVAVPTNVPVTPTPAVTSAPTASPLPTTAPSPIPGAFPDSSSTGPGATALVAYTGPAIITTPGTVISGALITTPLTIKAADVTVKNSVIRTSNISPDAGGTPILNVLGDGAQVLNNEITGTTVTAPANDGVKIYADGVTFSGNNVHNIADDGITIEGDKMTITGNYLHDFVYRAGVHYDGLVYDSSTTTTVLIQHNTLDMWLDQGGMNHTVNMGATAPHVTIDNNLIAGGGWTVSGGATYTNNVFSTVHAPKCGAFGTHAYTDNATWSNNKLSTGVVVPL